MKKPARRLIVPILTLLSGPLLLSSAHADTVFRVDGKGCPSIADHQRFVDEIVKGNVDYSYPPICVDLPKGATVSDPIERKQDRFGSETTEFILVDVKNKGRYWTLASWVNLPGSEDQQADTGAPEPETMTAEAPEPEIGTTETALGEEPEAAEARGHEPTSAETSEADSPPPEGAPPADQQIELAQSDAAAPETTEPEAAPSETAATDTAPETVQPEATPSETAAPDTAPETVKPEAAPSETAATNAAPASAPATTGSLGPPSTVNVSKVWFADELKIHFGDKLSLHGKEFAFDKLACLPKDITTFNVAARVADANLSVAGSLKLSALPAPFEVAGDTEERQGRGYKLLLQAYLFSPKGRLVWMQQGFAQDDRPVSAEGGSVKFDLKRRFSGSLAGYMLLVVAAGDQISSTESGIPVILGVKKLVFS